MTRFLLRLILWTTLTWMILIGILRRLSEPPVSPASGTIAFVVPQNDPNTVGSHINLLSTEMRTSFYVPMAVVPDSLAWSPDAAHLAFFSLRVEPPDYNFDYDLYLLDVNSGALSLLATELPDPPSFAWSPDSERIAYVQQVPNAFGADDAYRIALVTLATGDELYIQRAPNLVKRNLSWSPDGNYLLFTQVSRSRNSQVWENSDIAITNLDGSDYHVLTNNYAGRDQSPTWSPDGRQIAFLSDRAGTKDRYGMPILHVYVMNADGSDVRRVSSNQWYSVESLPLWSSDNNLLLFELTESTGSNHFSNLYVVDVRHRLMRPFTHVWSTMSPLVGDFAWSPDGTRVAYITLPQIAASLCIRAIGDHQAVCPVSSDDRLPKDGVAWSGD